MYQSFLEFGSSYTGNSALGGILYGTGAILGLVPGLGSASRLQAIGQGAASGAIFGGLAGGFLGGLNMTGAQLASNYKTAVSTRWQELFFRAGAQGSSRIPRRLIESQGGGILGQLGLQSLRGASTFASLHAFIAAVKTPFQAAGYAINGQNPFLAGLDFLGGIGLYDANTNEVGMKNFFSTEGLGHAFVLGLALGPAMHLVGLQGGVFNPSSSFLARLGFNLGQEGGLIKGLAATLGGAKGANTARGFLGEGLLQRSIFGSAQEVGKQGFF